MKISAQRLASFGLVGGIGFLVDAAMLALLLAATPMGPFSARLVAIGVALATTWQLNRRLTFAPSVRGLAAEGTRYGGVGLATAAINYAIYCIALWLVPALPPLVALAIASAAAMALSFAGYSKLVFDR